MYISEIKISSVKGLVKYLKTSQTCQAVTKGKTKFH